MRQRVYALLRTRWFAVFAVALTLGMLVWRGLGGIWQLHAGRLDRMMDFGAYYVAATAWRTGIDPYAHTLEAWARIARGYGVPTEPVPYLYPPLALLPVLPFTWLPFELATVIWTLLSIAAFVVAALLAAHVARQPIAPFLLVLAFFLPVHVTLSYGQVNGVVLLTMVAFLYWAWRRRAVWAGLAIGFGTHLKLFPAGLVAYLFVRRRWHQALWAATAVVTLMLLGLFVFGLQICLSFAVTRLGGLAGALFGPPSAASRFAADLFGSAAPRNPEQLPRLVLGALLLATGLLLAIGRPSLRGETALAVTTLVLISPIGGYHRLAALLLPFWYILDVSLSRVAPWPVTAGATLTWAAVNLQWGLYWAIHHGLGFLAPPCSNWHLGGAGAVGIGGSRPPMRPRSPFGT